MAINESTEKKLKLCQIYDWIKTNFPYYKVSNTFSVDKSIFKLNDFYWSLLIDTLSCNIKSGFKIQKFL